MEKVYIKNKQGDKVLPITHVSAVLDDQGNDVGSIMGTFEDEVRGLVDTPHQNYVTVSATSSTTSATSVLPASGQSADTIYRVANWDGSTNSGAGSFDVTKYSEYAWDDVSTPAKYVFLCVKSQIDEVFDITVYNNNTKYADLTAALGTGGANIPQSLRRGGMSVKYVQSYDNKYVQYRSIAQSFTTNEADWELDVTDKNLIYNPQEYTSSQKETARTNIGLSNITPKASTGEESLKVTTDDGKKIVEIKKTLSFPNNITITDDSGNEVLNVDKNGLHAKEIFYGQNETNLQDKIEYIEEQIGSGGSTRNVVLIMFMGQSNMAGRGITIPEHPQDAPAVIEGAGYEFKAISDPTKLYPITKIFGSTENVEHKIDDRNSHGDPSKTGGPVPSFVNAFYRVAKTTVIGVSASEGGVSIKNFQPDKSRYADAVDRFHAAETYLTNNNYNILARYVVWCQGEADGDEGMLPATYAYYFDTMANALFSAGIENIFLIRIGKYNNNAPGADPDRSYDDIINEQSLLCKSNDKYIMATTVLASLKDKGLMKDQFHYFQEGYNIEGTLSGLHTANYFLFGKSDVMYDVMTNALYFDSKSY